MIALLRRFLRPRPYAAPVRMPVLVVSPPSDDALLEEIRAMMRQCDEEAATRRREDAIGRFWAQREAVRGGRVLRGPKGRFVSDKESRS